MRFSKNARAASSVSPEAPAMIWLRFSSWIAASRFGMSRLAHITCLVANRPNGVKSHSSSASASAVLTASPSGTTRVAIP